METTYLWLKTLHIIFMVTWFAGLFYLPRLFVYHAMSFGMGWMHAKLTLAFLLVLYHLWLGKLMLDFKHDRNGRSHVFYRWINELPVVVLIGTVTLVIFKPF